MTAEQDDSSDDLDSEPDEVELLQQLLSMEQSLVDIQKQQQQQPQQAMQQLKQQEHLLHSRLGRLFLKLPRDLQAALFSSPTRQGLLQVAASVMAAGSSRQQHAASAVLQRLQELLINAVNSAETSP